MASSRNLPLILFVAGLGVAPMPAADGAAAKDPATDKVAVVSAAPADATKADAGKEKGRLDLPVPKGQPQRGLRIPMYSPEGKLMMALQIGVAEVLEADNIKMRELHLETFKDDGEHEFDIDLTDSVLNQKTWDLTSNVHVTIKRRDFEISGESVVFNLKTRVGKLGNGVKMVIYDARATADEANGKSEVPTIEVKPVKEEKK
jgi:hypothetical protein